MYRITITIILFSFIKLSSSNLCKICSCFKSDGMSIFDCDNKLGINTSDLNLLLYSSNNTPDELILSNNKFEESSLDVLKDFKNLKILNLSHNFLNGSNTQITESWTNLDNLDLSFNKWITFDTRSIIAMSSLSKLNLSYNSIMNFIPLNSSKLHHLTRLDLSHNNLTNINEQLLNSFPLLQYINLSFNSISSINVDSFENLCALKSLLLQNNFLKILNVNFPTSLKTLIISHNKFSQFPRNLSVNYLSINNNAISTIAIENKNIYKQLEYLNISGNSMSTFIDAEFSSLETLDISFNKFTNIPTTINTKNLPKLDTLVISGNPINKLKFNADIKLRQLVVRNLSLLNRIDQDTFDYMKEYNDECINMTISCNEKLESLDEKALNNINICYLDLGNNALKRIPQFMRGLQNNTFFKYGLNLQGNPLICDCASQWMLENLIPKLYKLNSQLLINLRCNEPPKLSNVRLIHWYKWKQKIFCNDNQSMSLVSIPDDTKTIYAKSTSTTIVLESTKKMLFVIMICAVILAILVIVGLIFSLKLAYIKRRKNRRF